MASTWAETALALLKRQDDDSDPVAPPAEGKQEAFASFALFILVTLLIVALFTSYIFQQRKIQILHETVLSIFVGIFIGLALRLTSSTLIQKVVSFDYQIFFNLLLPPIILASGYELHQANFFRNIGSILTFAFAGTFISAVVLALILWLWTRIPLDGFSISFVEAFATGATLSATDPVTILAIFNAYKVDPKLYTVIFGESILNDAVAIVLFETADKYYSSTIADNAESLSILKFFEAIGVFLLNFFGSLFIGVVVGVGTTLLLKFTHVRKFAKTESCLVILIAYASYFFSTGIGASGIVSLLFCGITMKHYAYYNMSRRTQLTTKFIFQVTAQLSENFIFIYLGLTLFTKTDLVFKPLFILVTVFGICVARYAAVFPLAKLINAVVRWRAKRRGQTDVPDELPQSYQVMLFWAGLRGAVGVALAAGMPGSGENKRALQATVLMVVVLTVIIFGGTTSKMLEIMGIKTGVVEEVDSDDEFDIETTANGTYYKRSNSGVGYTPRREDIDFRLPALNGKHPAGAQAAEWEAGFSSSSAGHSPPARPGMTRSGSRASQRERGAAQNLLQQQGSGLSQEDDFSDSDLPPAAPRRAPKRRPSPPHASNSAPNDGFENALVDDAQPESAYMAARGVLSELLSGREDAGTLFKRLDEGLIKPTLLLDQSTKGGDNV